jgi:hypothetical protein
MSDDDDKEPGKLRRNIFDALIVALVLAGSAALLDSNANVRLNSREIGRQSADIAELKLWRDEQIRDNRRLAETMATRADVKAVADEVRALAAELRNRNAR